MTDYKTAYEDARKEFRAYMELVEARIAEKNAMITFLLERIAELTDSNDRSLKRDAWEHAKKLVADRNMQGVAK